LLDAALDAFAERGFHGTSVEEVCERAGFSRGAFYSNYSSKTELFIALYHRQAENVLASLVDRAASPPEQTKGRDLATVVTEIMSMVPADRRWFLINTEFALHAVRNPAAGATFAQARAQVRSIFVAHLDEVLDHLDLELTVPPDTVARWLFALHEGSVSQAYVEPDKLAPHELSIQATPLLLAAVTRPVS
jgi:AcrR family transcriptional regulator